MKFLLGCCQPRRPSTPYSTAIPARPVSPLSSPQSASVPSSALPAVDYGTPLDSGIRRIMSNPRVAPVDFSVTHEIDFSTFMRENSPPPSPSKPPPTNEELEDLILNAERAMHKRYQKQSADYEPQVPGASASIVRDYAFINRHFKADADPAYVAQQEAKAMIRRTNMSAEARHLQKMDKSFALPFRPKVDNSLTKVDNSVLKVDNSVTKVDNSVNNDEYILPNVTYSRGNNKRVDSEEGAYDRKSGTGLDWGLGGPERRTGL